jgi:hypothetical protein
MQIFPYHLGEYVCRVLRVSPFKYYKDILASNMKDDAPYDAIPNFTAADALKVVGVGRNEYIAIMQQAKSKRLLWRVNKGLVRDLLPELPKQQTPAPWWKVCVVNLGEVEYRTMSPTESQVCRLAANYADGAPYKMLDPVAVSSLYARGLIWFNVPIEPEDHISIPPLEGFVSNKTSTLSSVEGIDPLETLLYQIFVAASEKVSVLELSEILNIPIDELKVGIAMACRLGFCNKLFPAFDEHDSGLASSALTETRVSSPVNVDSLSSPVSPGVEAEKKYVKSVAFVVDSAITGYLMMGALTPEVKKHSVTLFEGGRVYGASVILELINGLQSSLELSKDFEGEMLDLAVTAKSMMAVLTCLQSQGRPIELLRKESMESLPPEQAERILAHSYDILIPATGLNGPTLPISWSGPANLGPSTMSQSPWLNIALYRECSLGLNSFVIPCGDRLRNLDMIVEGASNLLVWRWAPVGMGAKLQDPLILSTASALMSLNSILARTAIMIQPLSDKEYENDSGPNIVYVTMPLPRDCCNEDEQPVPLEAFSSTDGSLVTIQVENRIVKSLLDMGIGHAIGCLKLLGRRNEAGTVWIPLGAQLGMPLYPASACEYLCASLSGTDFLSQEACDRQRHVQKDIERILQELASPFMQTQSGFQVQECTLPRQPFRVTEDGFIQSDS